MGTELSDAQHAVLNHAHGPLLIIGPPGSGKTRCLLERVVRLLARGASPAEVLVLSNSCYAAPVLRARLRQSLKGATGEPQREACSEPAVLTPEAFCADLLRDRAPGAGLDPFFVTATKADRLAMLLARSPELRPPGSPAQGRRFARMPRRAAGMLRALERIDRLKEALVDVHRYASWAAERAAQGDPLAEEATDLAELYLAHEQLLAEHEALDAGDLLLRTCALLDEGHAVGFGELYRHVVIDDFEDLSPALVTLVERLARDVGDLTVAGDEHQLAGFRSRHPAASVVSLRAHPGCAPGIERAAAAVLASAAHAPAAPEEEATANGDVKTGEEEHGQVSFWRCADERTQAQSVAADIERTVIHRARAANTRPGSLLSPEVAPDAVSAGRIAVVVRSLARDGRSLVGALKERAIPYRVVGGNEYFEHAEVRDLVAWMRLLRDPLDTNATIRLLMRSPVELRPAELARLIQLARRRKLDMPSALRAAVDLARFAPETRERIATFLEVYGELALALEQLRPDELVHRVIARTGLQRARLLSSEAQAVEALVGLARVEELASHFVRFSPHGSGRDFADYLTYAAEAGLSLEELVPGAADAERGSGDALVEVMSGDVLPANAFDHVYVVGLGAPRGNGRGSPGRSLLDASGGAPGELLAERLPAGSDLRSPGDLRWSLYRAICAARGRVVLVHVARDADRRAQAPPGAAEDARVALGARWENRQPPALEEGQVLDGAARILRQRALEDVARIGGRLGELRLDTDYDISHGVVRYLELLKLASLLERPPGQSFSDALLDLNARLLSACTPLEREIFESSPLDEALIAGLPGGASSLAGGLGSPAQIGASAATAAAHLVDTPEDSLLAAFLPRRGDGLVLSASDIETYRACPLRYKLARVLRIPAEPTPQQRFGIMVHKVLERYHSGWDGTPADMGKTLATLMRLLEGAWRRSGFRESPGELALLSKARDALTRYHGQLAERPGRPVWFERSFSFSVGPHLIRGRVDRIDQVPDDGYELIDYKTGHPRSPAQLEGDVQLSLYALAARRAWNLPATREAYYYVLDNRKVPLPHQQDDAQLEWVTDTIMSVGEGILALQFRPTPAYSVCSSCDYLTICPAAEA